jgi:transposase-like protein
MENGRNEVRWAPRVTKEKLRRLYQTEAKGILDDELIDDVGYTLLLRCQSILDVTEAMYQRKVKCPRCALQGRTTKIERSGARDATITCPVCSWQVTWRDYQKTFKHKQLHGGGAVDAFKRYVEQFNLARTPREKIIAIDRVIHEFHYSNRNAPEQPTRPASVNLIVGDIGEVVAFLDELSQGEAVSPEVAANQTEWKQKINSTFWPELLASKDSSQSSRR